MESQTVLTPTQAFLLAVTYWGTATLIWCAGFFALVEVLNLSVSTVVIWLITVFLARPILRRGYRVLHRGKFRAGIVVGALGWLYLPVFVVAGVIALSAESCDLDDISGANQDRIFVACLEELSDREGNHQGVANIVRATLSGQGLSLSTSQELVYDALINVCMQHTKSPREDLGPYFGATLRNMKNRHFREHSPGDACSVVDLNQYEDPTMLIDMRNARCSLEIERPELAEVIDLKADGFLNREIATRLGISESLVGNRVSDARDVLSEKMGRTRHRFR